MKLSRRVPICRHLAGFELMSFVKCVTLVALLCVIYMCHGLHVENGNTKENIEMTRMQLNEASVQKRLYEENLKQKMLEYEHLDDIVVVAREKYNGQRNQVCFLGIYRVGQ